MFAIFDLSFFCSRFCILYYTSSLDCLVPLSARCLKHQEKLDLYPRHTAIAVPSLNLNTPGYHHLHREIASTLLNTGVRSPDIRYLPRPDRSLIIALSSDTDGNPIFSPRPHCDRDRSPLPNLPWLFTRNSIAISPGLNCPRYDCPI